MSLCLSDGPGWAGDAAPAGGSGELSEDLSLPMYTAKLSSSLSDTRLAAGLCAFAAGAALCCARALLRVVRALMPTWRLLAGLCCSGCSWLGFGRLAGLLAAFAPGTALLGPALLAI